MQIYTFVKESYVFEIERKDKLDGAVGILLTAITGIVVSIIFVIRDEGLRTTYPNSEIVTACFVVCVLLMSISILFLLTGFHGRSYKYIDYPDKMLSYYGELKRFFKNNISKTDMEFLDAIVRQYAEFGSHNAKANDEKSELYFQAKRWFAWSLLPFVCGAVAYAHFLVFLQR